MDHQVGNITLNKYLARTGSCQDISRNPAVTAPYPEKFGFLLMLLVIKEMRILLMNSSRPLFIVLDQSVNRFHRLLMRGCRDFFQGKLLIEAYQLTIDVPV